MRGGAISFSFHRRCGIYVLLIHSDIFYASNDRSMLIPFSSKTEVAGRWRTQGLGGKYNLEPRGGSVEIFHPTVGPDLGVAQAPSYLCEGKETASVAYASSGAFWTAESRAERVRAMPKRKNEDEVNGWMRSRSAKPISRK